MAYHWKTVGSLLSIAVILLAYLYRKQADEQLQEHLQNVLRGLLRAEKNANCKDKPRAAIGFGSCQDRLVNAQLLFDTIDLKPPEESKHHDVISSAKDLAETFSYFFNYGAAAERFTSDKKLFKDLVKAASELPGVVDKIGGNAAVMANRLALEGYEILLGAKMSAKTKSELEEDVKIAGFKNNSEDDVHLILEYTADSSWGKYRAPRANRLIIHSDTSNPMLESLESFQEEFQAFKPHLVIIGGLQMMDNFPFEEEKRNERLYKLTQLLQSIDKKIPIHFELASFTEAEMLSSLRDLVPLVDSIGMNEQELPNLYSLLNYQNASLVSDPYPRVATVLDQMRMVYNQLKNLDGSSSRGLTRLHVHTLAFQAILTQKKSFWKNSMAAAAKASLTAYRHVCGSAKVDTGKARIIMDNSFSTSTLKPGSKRIPLKSNSPVSCWDEEDYSICVAPVLVCTEIVQTAGGGDNISSAGLALQI